MLFLFILILFILSYSPCPLKQTVKSQIDEGKVIYTVL